MSEYLGFLRYSLLTLWWLNIIDSLATIHYQINNNLTDIKGWPTLTSILIGNKYFKAIITSILRSRNALRSAMITLFIYNGQTLWVLRIMLCLGQNKIIRSWYVVRTNTDQHKCRKTAWYPNHYARRYMSNGMIHVQWSFREIACTLNKFWLVDNWFLGTRSSGSRYIAQWNNFLPIRIQDTGCLLTSDWLKIVPLCDVSTATGPKSTFNQSEPDQSELV